MKLKAFWLVIKVAGKNMNGLYFLVEHQKKQKTNRIFQIQATGSQKHCN